METKQRIRLVALDLDGTLLNEKGQVSGRAAGVLNQAIDAGLEPVICTGRCLPEIQFVFEAVPRIRYAICVSGAYIWDNALQRCLTSYVIPTEVCKKAMDLGKNEDAMLHLLSLKSAAQNDQMEHMERYGMGHAKQAFRSTATGAEDIRAEFDASPYPVNKLNYFCPDSATRDRIRACMEAEQLPLELVNADATSLECSPIGITKGTALLELCCVLCLKAEETAAVGDSNNDLAVLKTVGLPIAMGNANEQVKAVCRHTTSDNRHDGCAEAIEWILSLQPEQKTKN
ncbi:MAG: Cof-type HAD-IIB family hydrolase [Oscillospiraceae bacterium]|nr:Cof-type HAD-IIB family hydrolase [Oscillospiraceae bacterium]